MVSFLTPASGAPVPRSPSRGRRRAARAQGLPDGNLWGECRPPRRARRPAGDLSHRAAGGPSKNPGLREPEPGPSRMQAVPPADSLAKADPGWLQAGLLASGWRAALGGRARPSAAPSHPDDASGQWPLRRSSPVTAARPRPIRTAFPLAPAVRRTTCNDSPVAAAGGDVKPPPPDAGEKSRFAHRRPVARPTTGRR